MTLESELETIRTNIVTNLTSKGVTASNTESLNDLVGKVNTVKTPITSSLVLKETYQNDISGVVDCLRDKFRINLSKQGVETSSTAGLTTLADSINLIKQDTVLTLTSDKSSACTGETVTLTATLVDVNGNPVNGATVVFMEGSSTLYSGITNNLGVANYTYSSTETSVKSLKCVFNGNTGYNLSNSNIISLTVINYLFYDDCTTDKSNNYTLIKNSSLTYNSDGYYTTTNNGYDEWVLCKNINVTGNYQISVEMQLNCNSWTCNCYPVIYKDNSNNITGFAQGQGYYRTGEYISGSEIGSTPNTTQSWDKYSFVRITLTLQGTTVTSKLEKLDGTLISTHTLNITSNYDNARIGLFTHGYINFKNLKVKQL